MPVTPNSTGKRPLEPVTPSQSVCLRIRSSTGASFHTFRERNRHMSDDTSEIDPNAPLPTHHQTPEEIITWYAHLGMYVQAFEWLVQAVRTACVELTTPGASDKPRGIQIN